MNDKCFCDTNLWVYLFSDSESDKEKSKKSEEIIISGKFLFISTQVINELSNVFIKKYKINEEDLKIHINTMLNIAELDYITEIHIFKAIDLKKKYGFSFYDALIVASALKSDCKILYSEDMHKGLIVDDKLTIINPFI